MNRSPFVLAIVAAAVLCSCAAAPRRPPVLTDTDYPGLLRAPSTLGRHVLWRQRVTAAWEGGERGFDAAVQCHGDTLTLIGLAPVGPPGFVVTQEASSITLRNETDEQLPFPPRFILLDFQRVFFPWLPEDGALLRAPGRGTRRVVVGDERVEEDLVDGRLVERRFERVDGVPEGVIRVEYEWDRPELTAPSRAVLDNGWFGYRLTIETLEETPLPPPAGG